MLLESTNVETIVRELSADLETPVSLYLKLRGQGASFLLESVEGGERIARYSFIGVSPKARYILRNGVIQIVEGETVRSVQLELGEDPTRFLQAEMARFPASRVPNAPRFTGGMVGYLGYEAVRYFEPTLAPQMHPAATPDGMYLLADTIVAFDHARRSLFLIANVLDGDPAAACCFCRSRCVLPPRGKRTFHRTNAASGRARSWLCCFFCSRSCAVGNATKAGWTRRVRAWLRGKISNRSRASAKNKRSTRSNTGTTKGSIVLIF